MIVNVSPGRVGRWMPAEVSSHTPTWPRSQGWFANTPLYNPAHYLTPAKRWRLAHPQNYVIPRATYVPKPNPYVTRLYISGGTIEEKGRLGQDIDWVTLGTSGT